MKRRGIIRQIRNLLLLIVLNLMGCSMAMVRPLADKQTADIGGHTLEYVMAGEGSPVIVFLSGYGADIDTSWSKVYPEAEKISTVFAYNRFGYGASDKLEQPQSGALIVNSLRDILREKGLMPPYVLVGHSLGGIYANLFARQYPHEVSGVILIDSSHPDQIEMMRSRQGLIRQAMTDVIWKIDSVFHRARHSEISSFNETASQIKKAGPFPDIPLVVITAGKEPPSWLIGAEAIRIHEINQKSLVTLSPQAKQIIAEKSGHFVQNDEPEIVIQAIHDITDKARGSSVAGELDIRWHRPCR